MTATEFVYATYIRTTPEKLRDTLTNGDFSEKYWFGLRVEVEQKASGKIRILPPKGMEKRGDHAGEVLICEPYRQLVYRWNPTCPPQGAKKRPCMSRVTCEVKPRGTQMRLRLIHENLLPEDIEKNPDTFPGINNGWPAVLSNLKSPLETGRR